jgi:hypothetical protein
MKLLILAYRNELTKILKAPGVMFFCVAPTLPALLVFVFIIGMSYDEFLMRIQSTSNDPNPYHYVLKWFRILFNFFLIPFVTSFLLWLTYTERKAGSYKYLMTLPLSLSYISIAKVSAGLSFILVSLVIAAITFSIDIHLLSSFKRDWNFPDHLFLSYTEIFIQFGTVFLLLVPVYLVIFIAASRFNYPAALLLVAMLSNAIDVPVNPFAFHSNVLHDEASSSSVSFTTLVAALIIMVGSSMILMNEARLRKLIFSRE